MPEGRPNNTSGMPKRAVSAAARMSQDAAISRPAPKQYPLIRAMTGTGARRMASHTRCVNEGPSAAWPCTNVDISATSAPPMNDRSPAPVSTMTRRSDWAETRSNVSASSRLPELPSALRRAAVSTVMSATPRSSVSARIRLTCDGAIPRRAAAASGRCRNTCRHRQRKSWANQSRRGRSVPAYCCGVCPCSPDR